MSTDTVRTRRILFTKEVLEKIPLWVMDNKTEDWIAHQIGCTLGTLVSTCSKYRISLSKELMLKKEFLPRDADHTLPLVRVTLPCLQELSARADKLGIRLDWLITVVLDNMVKGKLLDTVLDLPKKSKSKP